MARIQIEFGAYTQRSPKSNVGSSNPNCNRPAEKLVAVTESEQKRSIHDLLSVVFYARCGKSGDLTLTRMQKRTIAFFCSEKRNLLGHSGASLLCRAASIHKNSTRTQG